jgi:cyclopropane fatty-acyl-phospholipid synthase-like methyltransferase
MTTYEKQYQAHVDLKNTNGLTRLGVDKNGSWHEDPRRMVFVMSRYKFVSKMLSGYNKVLEVGCGDAWPVRIVLQEVKSVHGIDIDPIFVDDANERMDPKWPFTVAVHDMTSGPVPGAPFDAAYSLDVLEHIPKGLEETFLGNVMASLSETAPLIVGMPSLQSQQYASPLSGLGHVNCKDAPEFKSLMKKYFHTVFMCSMNDEVVHTGFFPMAQYYFALCAHRR